MDIYFLLDVSGSMKPYRDQLVEVPEKLVKVLLIMLHHHSSIHQ